MTDRPIVSRGQYNLNFVDWNNEWERVIEEYDDQDFENQIDLSVPNETPIIDPKRSSTIS